jgi:hypothetical protein
MLFKKKIKPKSINFDDTNKLLLDIQRLLIRESRKDKIKKIFRKSDN